MNYTVKDFLPLIIIFILIILFVAVRQGMYGFDMQNFMYDFMGSFFIIFGAFKVVNLAGFANAYSMYDIIAKQSIVYAYIYPFIELALGAAFLMRYQLVLANWVTVVLMAVSSIGVASELMQGKEIVCACLGAVFKIPMTYVTLAEDILMGLMALGMLIQYYFFI